MPPFVRKTVWCQSSSQKSYLTAHTLPNIANVSPRRCWQQCSAHCKRTMCCWKDACWNPIWLPMDQLTRRRRRTILKNNLLGRLEHFRDLFHQLWLVLSSCLVGKLRRRHRCILTIWIRFRILEGRGSWVSHSEEHFKTVLSRPGMDKKRMLKPVKKL